MKKVLFLVPVGVLFFCSIARASSDHLWISQVQTTGGSGKTTNDFVEIFNPTGQDIDLQGFRLVKRTQTGTTDTLIKSWTDSAIVVAGGYYLWANSGFLDLAVAPDATTSGTLSDNNGIALRQGASDTGIIIDSVAWGNSTNVFVEGSVFATNPAVNEALVRTQDTDDNSTDFSLGTPNPHKSAYVAPAEPPPSPVEPPPGPTPTPPPATGGSGSIQYSSDIIISEFLPNPDGADSGAEWAELYNNSSSDVDLTGWYLDDEGNPGTVGSSAYVFPSGSTIPANSFKVIELPDGVFALDNTGGDTLRLIWPNKQSAQEVVYSDSAPTDTSYARKSDDTFVWTAVLTKNAVNQFVVAPAEKPAVVDSTTKDLTPVLSAPIIRPIVLISELFPEPDRHSDQDEFIELFNPTEKDIDLTGAKIADLVSSYKLTGVIPANGYFVINKSDSNISLNNSGAETATLTDAAGEMLASVSYSDAPSEQSYNLMPDGRYLWSTDLTPGYQNNISTPKVQLAVASTIGNAAVKTENPTVEASTFSATEPIGEISGANISQIPEAARPISFWPWLVASIALNLLFSYILVKLMATSRQ